MLSRRATTFAARDHLRSRVEHREGPDEHAVGDAFLLVGEGGVQPRGRADEVFNAVSRLRMTSSLRSICFGASSSGAGGAMPRLRSSRSSSTLFSYDCQETACSGVSVCASRTSVSCSRIWSFAPQRVTSERRGLRSVPGSTSLGGLAYALRVPRGDRRLIDGDVEDGPHALVAARSDLADAFETLRHPDSDSQSATHAQQIMTLPRVLETRTDPECFIFPSGARDVVKLLRFLSQSIPASRLRPASRSAGDHRLLSFQQNGVTP